MSEYKNRLQFEKSPYLLQHQNNPVDWFPWSEEAFAKAKKENKPIFLSIGYSTCHWCHVMERVCFEDHEVANLMNEVFISIKVDREERPDIDNIYMTVCQLMTGQGGWPLTIIMTPEKKPFYSATYLPKNSMPGRIGMMEFIPAIKKNWDDRREEIDKSAGDITEYLNKLAEGSPGKQLDEFTLERTYSELTNQYDKEYGGLARSPKFPTPQIYMFLLRYWLRNKDPQALDMVENTFKQMRRGGIYDHIGFGFHRYSTDKFWFLPHFEKMLYDEALLTIAYTECYQATENPYYAKTAQEIIDYVSRDLLSPEGGFYSAEDADSEGEEGKFYVWTYDEIKKLLSEDEFNFAVTIWNIDKIGNYIDEASGQNLGTNILHLRHNKRHQENADEHGLSKEEYCNELEKLRKKLFEERKKRIRPHLDDKILCDWNALMIVALSKAYRSLENQKYLELAEKAMNFILNTMTQDNGRLYHRYRDKESAIEAHLDDYAFTIWALIELYEASFKIEYLVKAIEFNQYVMEAFWDTVNGGFYFSSKEVSDLISRNKEIYDGAIPSGTSVMSLNLVKLSRITGDIELEHKAIECGRSNGESYLQGPSNFCMMMNAVDFIEGPSYEIIIVGDLESEDTKAMLRAIRRPFLPNKVVLIKKGKELDTIAPYTKEMTQIEGKATVYICRGFACQNPVTEIGEVKQLLNIYNQN